MSDNNDFDLKVEDGVRRDLINFLSSWHNKNDHGEGESVWSSSLKENAPTKNELIDKTLYVLATQRLSKSKLTSLVKLVKSGTLSRGYVYLALAGRRDVCDLQSFIAVEDRVTLSGEKRTIERLLDESRNLVLELFLLTLKKREDWLSYVVELVGNYLSKKNSLETVESLLECSPLSCVWELVVLHLSQNISSREALLAATLQIKEKEKADAAVIELASYLHQRLSVLTWLEERRVDIRPVPQLSERPLSTLRVLHKASVMASLPWEDTHTFLLESVQSGVVSPWEVSMFDAIQSILLSLDAIQTASGSRDRLAKPTSAFTADQHYQENVFTALNKLKRIVNQLQPLTLRVETLENIFGLLLIRHEDFHEDPSESGTEEEDRSTSTTAAASQDTGTTSMTDQSVVENPAYRWNPQPGKASRIQSLQTTATFVAENQLHARRHGFLCGPNITRDLLLLLKESVDSMSAGCYSVLTAELNEWEVPSMIDHHELQSHIRRLSGYVHDALWRLEVLTSSEFIRAEGQLASESVPYPMPLSDWTYVDPNEEESESEDESTVVKSPATKKSSKLKSDADRSSGSSTPEYLGTQTNKTWRLRRRSQCGSSFAPSSTQIIERMLCTPTSLTNQCLLRGDIQKAKQIVEMFSLSDTATGAAVQFSDHYYSLHRRHGSVVIDSKHKSSPGSQSSTLQAVQRAASAGVQALQINYEIDELLSRSALPEVPDVDCITGGSPQEHAVAVAAADLTLTLAKTAQQARSFLGLATQRCPELAKLHSGNNTSLESAAYCFIPFLRSLIQVTEPSDEGSPLALLQRWDLDAYTTRSIRDHIQFWESLNLALTEWYENYDDAGFSKLVQSAILVNSLKVSEADKVTYMQELQSYLQLLQKTLTSVSPADWPASTQYTSFLKMSPFTLLSSLFHNGAPVQKLEAAVASLGCSLPYMLLLSFVPSPPSIKSPTQTESVILNDGMWPAQARKASLVASSLLEAALHELFVLWKDLQLVSGKECKNLPVSVGSSKRLLAVLADSRELAVVDLHFLQEGDETTAFFCNVANLFLIHAILHTQLNNGDTASLLSPLRSQRMCAQSLVFYRIGHFGPLSLWQIMQMALGSEAVNVPSPSVTQIVVGKKLPVLRDPRLLLAVATGCPTSPVVQVLRARRLNEQLEGAVREYVRYWTRLCDNKLEMPFLIKRYLEMSNRPPSDVLQICNLRAPSEADNLELRVIPEENSKPVFVLSYGTATKWPCTQPEDTSPEITSPDSALSDNQLTNTLEYLEKECWPAALALKISLFKEKPDLCEISQPIVERMIELPHTSLLASLLDIKVGVSALYSFIPDNLLWSSLDNLMKQGKWKKILDLLSALPVSQTGQDASLRALLDVTLLELVIQGPSEENPAPWLYCIRLSSAILRAQCARTCAFSWPGVECCEVLREIAHDPSLEEYSHLKSEISSLLAKAEVCQKVLEKFPLEQWNTWNDVFDCWQTDPLKLLDILRDPSLCLHWSQVFPMPEAIPASDVDRIVRLLLQADCDDVSVLERALTKLPRARTAHTCVRILPNVSSIPLARCILRFLDSTCKTVLSPADKDVVQLASLGLQMIEVLPTEKQDESLRLMALPHLLLEQMLMNMRLEAASQMLAKVRDQLTNLGHGFPLSTSSVDLLLRTYAEKALEFRVVVATSDSSTDLSCSMSSYSSSRGRGFVIPPNVPRKTDWVPNEKAAVCMSCGVATFSMFNRRHHCRRCGRVICAACSPNKLQVEGYGTLKVRVCSECLTESLRGQSPQEMLSQSSEPHRLGSIAGSSDWTWQLTASPAVNDTVRDEFAYEHAPSVSLCLSILQLHSRQAACPSFLLDCSEKMLDHLQPIAPSTPNPEVDYALVIQMCRSLVVAAKVKCAQWGYTSGISPCDQLLSQIDLFSLLVKHGCSGMIMYEVKAPKGSSSLKRCAEDLRRLRHRLLKEEFWELALEVSTKGGLDRNGVWAAWGKACLEAGLWEKAREKFAECFVGSAGSSRPTKDSPLLLEILQILDHLPKANQATPQKREGVKKKAKQPTRPNAETVLLSLASLKDIAQGKLEQTIGGRGLESQVYTECCFYLRAYGSHSHYLQFLVRHQDFEKALLHVQQNSLEAQSFFDWLYIPCLRSGLITNLHATMTRIDPTLKVWMKYLRGVCAILEKRRLLNVLYEVQQWAGDHVRAAMTCIRFFGNGASTYTDLVARLKFLTHAQAHLDAALAEVSALEGQEQSVSPKESGVPSAQAIPLRLSANELCRHQTTIWRQIELTKFLASCEADQRPVLAMCDSPEKSGSRSPTLPTLFNSAAEREQLAALAILCGTNVEEGFGVAMRIVGDFKLDTREVYKRVGVGLVRQQRVQDVLRLLECIRSAGESDMQAISDDILLASVEAGADLTPAQAEVLVKNISDTALKIKAYIASRQLKSAYLLAVKCNRLQDIELVLGEAERLGQSAIKNICLKRLGRS